MQSWIAVAIGALIVLAAMILMPRLRRAVALLLNLAIGLVSIAFIVVGVSLLLNDVALFEAPGPQARLVRFLSVNYAATSPTGDGFITCDESLKLDKTPRARVRPTPAPARSAEGQPAGRPDQYPELVQRGYPGISRSTLFKLARQAVGNLPGWQVVEADPRQAILQCTCTTRVLRFVDDVKIMVTSNNEIGLCSSSRIGTADLGANIGHIKAFYGAMEPLVEAAYKQEEKRQSADNPR